MTVTAIMKIFYFLAMVPIVAFIVGGMIVVIVLATHKGNF